MGATCGSCVDKGVDSLWIACGRGVDGIRGGADQRSAGTVGKLPTPWGKFLVYKHFPRVCEARVRGFAASPASHSPKTTKGRPQSVDAPKSLRDKGCATGGCGARSARSATAPGSR